jgi:circadian clock protein KaiC
MSVTSSEKHAVAPPDPGGAKTGIEGLDEVLAGGIPRDRLFLIEGNPGVGKTTLGLRFAMAGRDAGEQTLSMMLSKSLYGPDEDSQAEVGS